jgi:cystathionine beta-synthase
MRYGSLLDAIGRTPLIRLSQMTKGMACPLYAKLEFLNPGGSVKDRIGLRMVVEAERRGDLKPGGTIVECTSGNTGMGIAIAARLKGYKTIFTVNDKQSEEKIGSLKALGAEVIVCPTAVPPEDERHYVQVARKLAAEIPGAWLANQYDNPDNAAAHYDTTGPEIWQDTEGKVTHFVAGMGTCGTISGVGKYLKERNPKVQIVGVDPEGSLFYDFFHKGKVTEAHTYKVEGIGEDFFPKVLNWDVVDDVVRVTDKESFQVTRKLARSEAIFAGGSSGAALAGALKILPRLGSDDLAVVLFPDSGSRYLNKIYNDNWMRDHQFLESPIQLTAMDILKGKRVRDLVFLSPGDTASEALRRMRELDVSQLPVLDRETVAGTVYEDDLVELVIAGKEIKALIVREIMKPPLPIVGRETSLEEITRYIPHQAPALLVQKGNGSLDIITKYDLVRTVGEAAESRNG